MNETNKKILFSLAVGIITYLITSKFEVAFAIFIGFLIASFFSQYKNYINNNPQKLWFKRKLFGWGWTPATWQGWIVTLIYVLLVVLFSLTINENSPKSEVVFTFILPVIVLTFTLIRIAYKKGEKPKWQWGQVKDKKN